MGFFRGKRVLDYGTGTGIQAFTALKLGAASVVGAEVDLQASREALHNAALNGMSEDVFQVGLAAFGLHGAGEGCSARWRNDTLFAMIVQHACLVIESMQGLCHEEPMHHDMA